MAKKFIKIFAILIVCILSVALLVVPSFAVTWVTEADQAIVYSPFQDIEYIKVITGQNEYYIDFDSVVSIGEDYINNTVREKVLLASIDSMNDNDITDNKNIPVMYRISKSSSGTDMLIFYFLQSATIDGVTYVSPLFDGARATTFEFKLRDGVYDSLYFTADYQIRYGFTGNFKNNDIKYDRVISASLNGIRETKIYEDEALTDRYLTSETRKVVYGLRDHNRTEVLGAENDYSLFDLRGTYNQIPKGFIAGSGTDNTEYQDFIIYDASSVSSRYLYVSDYTTTISISNWQDSNFVLFMPLTDSFDSRSRITDNYYRDCNIGTHNYDIEYIETLPRTFLGFLDGFSDIFNIRIFGSVTLGAICIIPLAVIVVLAIMRKFAGG